MKKLVCLLFLLLLPLSVAADNNTDASENTKTSELLEAPDFYKKNASPISIKEVIFKTLENNLNIKISDYDRKIAEAEIQVQKSIYDLLLSSKVSVKNSEYQQPVNMNPDYIWEKQIYGELGVMQLIPTGGSIGFIYTTSKNKTNSMGVDFSPYYIQSGTLLFNQPLLKNFGPYVTNSGIRISSNNEKISQEAFIEIVQNQIADAARAYWNLVFAIENYEVSTLSLRQANDFLRITTISFQTGVIPETDVLQAKAQVAFREEEVITAEKYIKQAQDQLKILMNMAKVFMDWEKNYLPTEKPEVKDIAIDTEAFIDEAFENRPDYKQVNLGLENAEIGRKVAKNQRLPELNFSAALGRSGLGDSHNNAWHELNTYDYHNYDFSLEFRFPLQNRSARYKYKQALLEKEKTQKSIENLENLIVFEVRNAVRNLETERKRVDVTNTSVESEKAKLDSETQRYRVGMSTSYNVLEFQKDYSEALVKHISSKINYNKSIIDLELSKGTILENCGIILNEEN
jgi:outer membrane protein